MTGHTRRIDWPGAVAALGFAALGLFAVAESLAMTAMGAIFPRTIGGVLVGLSLLQAVRCLLGRGGPTGPADGERGGSTARRVALAAILLAWVVLFPVVGFVVTSLVAALALMAVAEFDSLSLRTTATRAAVVVAMVALFHWLMVSVLHIPMPRALLF